MGAQLSRKSYRVRLPDGSEIEDWTITQDVMSIPNGIMIQKHVLKSGQVEWCVEDDGISYYWECRFRDRETQGDVIVPAYDEAPRLVEVASGVDLLWPRS